MTQLDNIQTTNSADTSVTSNEAATLAGDGGDDVRVHRGEATGLLGGGRAAHASGRAHEFSHDEARAAGKKGGLAPHVTRGGPRKSKAAEA
jgi:hypothetical protein